MKKTNSLESYKKNLRLKLSSISKPFKLRKNSSRKKLNFRAKSISKRYLHSRKIWSLLSLRSKLNNKWPMLTKLWPTLYRAKLMKFKR
jgi:hypothetical protein